MDLHKPKPIRNWRELLTEVGTIVPSPDHLPASFSIGSISGAGGGSGAIAGLRVAGTGTGTTSTDAAWLSPALAVCVWKSISEKQSP